jgi:hypothetical protein
LLYCDGFRSDGLCSDGIKICHQIKHNNIKIGEY